MRSTGSSHGRFKKVTWSFRGYHEVSWAFWGISWDFRIFSEASEGGLTGFKGVCAGLMGVPRGLRGTSTGLRGFLGDTAVLQRVKKAIHGVTWAFIAVSEVYQKISRVF